MENTMNDAINNIMKSGLKAEAVYADLLQNGYGEHEIATQHLGAFRKIFRNDIEALQVEEDSAKRSVEMDLNRDGIYDLLPEGLFHQSKGMQVVKTTKDAVLEHRVYKEEEREARKFFTPLEQLIFRYAAYAEAAGRQARYDMNRGRFNDAFCKFWGIDDDMPELNRNRMLELMPFLPIIKCDKEATRISLQYILQTKVELVEEYIHHSQDGAIVEEEYVLGLNTNLGKQLQELYPCWVFNIYEIKKKQMELFIGNEKLGKLLRRFTEIFIPFYMDTIFEFIPEEESTQEEQQYILGYGAVL